jgi:hypothetical protein
MPDEKGDPKRFTDWDQAELEFKDEPPPRAAPKSKRNPERFGDWSEETLQIKRKKKKRGRR